MSTNRSHFSSNQSSTIVSSLSRRPLLQELFRLVDLRRKVRTSAAIRVVQEHHLSMLLAKDLFRDAAFSVKVFVNLATFSLVEGVWLTMSPISTPLLACSSAFQIHLCRRLSRARWCLLDSGEGRPDLRDPVMGG